MSTAKSYANVPSSADDVLELTEAAGGAPVSATAEPVEDSEGRFLEVASPADLPGNYSFEVDVEGRTAVVTAPAGGARKGQVIRVPLPEDWEARRFPGGWAAVPRVKAPVGRWKDGLCDCFTHGVCHTWLCTVYYCPFVAMGQVMTRLGLTWCGQEATVEQAKKTFSTLFWISIATYVISPVFSLLLAPTSVALSANGPYSADSNVGAFAALHTVRSLIILALVVFRVLIVCRTRRQMRTRYQIPEQSCSGCEDCCCSFWCSCCTIAQMGRHTADYDTYAARCCTENGHPAHVPSVGASRDQNRLGRAPMGGIV